MYQLQRITSEYIESEDRIRLSGEDGKGNGVVLWLTQRLLSQLISHLVGLIEKQTPDITKNTSTADLAGNLMQGFAQRAAQADLSPELPVRSADNSQTWLIREVDVTLNAEGTLALVFKRDSEVGTLSEAGEEVAVCNEGKATLSVEAKQLRQWLGIIHTQWQRADWPIALWPDWMDAIDSLSPKNETPLH